MPAQFCAFWVFSEEGVGCFSRLHPPRWHWDSQKNWECVLCSPPIFFSKLTYIYLASRNVDSFSQSLIAFICCWHWQTEISSDLLNHDMICQACGEQPREHRLVMNNSVYFHPLLWYSWDLVCCFAIWYVTAFMLCLRASIHVFLELLLLIFYLLSRSTQCLSWYVFLYSWIINWSR